MALVRFCQGDRLQGTQRSGEAIRTRELAGGGGGRRSKPLKASYSLWAGEGEARTPASRRVSSPHAVGFAGGVSAGSPPPAAWLGCCCTTLDGAFLSLGSIQFYNDQEPSHLQVGAQANQARGAQT